MTQTTAPKSSTRFSPDRLKAVREMKGLSLDAFGKPIKKTGRCIRNWEDGVTAPRTSDLEGLAAAYGFEIGFLFVAVS